MVTVQKNDFVQVEFTGRITDTKEIFDTNVKSEIEKAKLNFEAKPYIIAVGHNMALKGLDAAIEGKEIGKEYSADFPAEKAFGKRNPSMIKMIPIKSFLEQKIKPEKGMQLALDGTIVKIVSVSGGRVLVDFNNPLAGKKVSYNYKIVKKLEDEKEKIDALQDFFFRKKFDSEVKGKELKLIVPPAYQQFVEMMAKPFQDILGLKVKTEPLALDKKETKSP